MAYEHGSIDLGIRNPFKIEGCIDAVRGLLVFGMGVTILLSVGGIVETYSKAQGTFAMIVGAIFIASGLRIFGSGIYRLLRYFVGRDAPSSLAQNEGSGGKKEDVQYTSEDLAQMLQGRKNSTFEEPLKPFDRLVHSIMPKLVYMPYAYRNLAQKVLSGLTVTIGVFTAYGLAWFILNTGIVPAGDLPVMDWLALLVLLYLIVLWRTRSTPLKRMYQSRLESTSSVGIVAWIFVAALILPIALIMILGFISEISGDVSGVIPTTPTAAGPWLILLTVLAILATGIALLLISLRSRDINPRTEVAEFRENWQRSLHPKELFINFHDIVMANRRYKEVPNRLYRKKENLQGLGDSEMGKEFAGEMLVEIQPVALNQSPDPVYQVARIAVTILGNVVLLLAAFLIYRFTMNLATFTIPPMELPADAATAMVFLQGLLGNFSLLIAAMIFHVFGTSFVNYAHAFWAELRFESLLVYFQCRGTYAESEIVTKAGIYGGVETRAKSAQASITFWVLATRVMTSVFSASGVRNLEYPRLVLEMRPADVELTDIVTDIGQFADSRVGVKGLEQGDIEALKPTLQINQNVTNTAAASLTSSGAPTGLLDVEHPAAIAARNQEAEDTDST